jgi:hypothetical protein
MPVLLRAGEGAVVFQADFTKGPAGLPDCARVIGGGEWRAGWRVTNNGQRVVFDAGYPVKNGRFEATFTRWDVQSSEAAFAAPPLHAYTYPFALYEEEKGGGDSFKLEFHRGAAENVQSAITGRVKEQAGGAFRWNQKVGKWSDWVLDDTTPLKLQFEWRDGKASYRDSRNQVWPCPEDCMRNMNALRYMSLGADANGEWSLSGMRLLSATLVDFDLPEKAAEPRPAGRRVLFDVDLTKGPSALPAQSVALGGQWEDGWRVTANRQRIVMDPGYHIRNGSLEVTMTRKRAVQLAGKINGIGIYEDPAIDQVQKHGDIFYLRMGITDGGNVKAFVKRELKPGEGYAHTGLLWEQPHGKFTDWPLDDTTPATVKLEWKNGSGAWTTVKGEVLACPDNCAGELDRLRYVVLGGDRYDGGGSLIGLRFLRVVLTDLGE